MKRVLVYVDAENINVEKFNQLKEELDSLVGYSIVGKFYGDVKVLGEISTACYCAGFDFVDTANLSHSQKNVTDMKIAVDCISDVMHVFNDDVDLVYIVSSDHDFMPLIYKLKGLRLCVKAPFLVDAEEHQTMGDIGKCLDREEFATCIPTHGTEKPLELIRSVTKGQFTYNILKEYVDRKKQRLAKELREVFGEEVYLAVREIPIEDFDFRSVLEVTGVTDIPRKLDLFNAYSKKMFGVCLTKADALRLLTTN